jgi:transposase
MPAPHALPITVSAADRLTVQGWARRPKTAQALALRACIVLAAVEPEASNGEIAERLGTHRHTVAKWRRRYATRGLAGLTDEPRPGAPQTVTDDRVDAVLATTLEQAPPVGTQWSTRQLAVRLGLSQTAVSRIWRAFGLQPHRSETFKLSTDHAVRGEGPRHCRPVSRPTRAGARAARGREAVHPGDHWHRPRAADAAGAAGAAHPRLRAARHARPVRGARRAGGDGDQRGPPATPERGVPGTSSTPSTRPRRPSWTCTSSSTTRPRTRRS